MGHARAAMPRVASEGLVKAPRGYTVEIDRRRAIERALGAAHPGDVDAYISTRNVLLKLRWAVSHIGEPLEFAGAIPSSEISAPVAQLTELYQSARFGEHAAPIEQMSSLLRSIRDTLRSRKS